MLTVEEQEFVTRVGPGTPMGELLRRYWVPALLSEELAVDGPPKAIRLLGEDLVAFRDSAGRVGVMDVHCPHRLASLALGRNEESGLRCLYHGWKLDVDGHVLETPCEPPFSRMKEHVVQRAYGVHEAADLVWVYMGPREHEPPMPEFNWMRIPSTHRSVGKMWEECNFVQACEGVLDTFHTSLLHTGYEVMHWTHEQIAEAYSRPSRASWGEIDTEDTAYGFRYVAARRPDLAEVDTQMHVYLRISEFVFPFFCLNPPDLGTSSRPFIFVPIDDYNTYLFEVRASEGESDNASGIKGTGWTSNGPVDREAHLAQSGMRPGIDLDDDFRPRVNKSNRYNQDRALMAQRTHWASYSGITGGIQMQDLAMIESMGRISDRSREHLGASDQAIRRWRQRLVRAVREFVTDGQVPAQDPPLAYPSVRAVAVVADRRDDWRAFVRTSTQGDALGGRTVPAGVAGPR